MSEQKHDYQQEPSTALVPSNLPEVCRIWYDILYGIVGMPFVSADSRS